MPQIQFIQEQDRGPEYLSTGLNALARSRELNLARAKEIYDMSHSLPASMRVAIRNRAYEMAGMDGYKDSFEAQQPNESDEEFYARMSGAAQNPKGIAGAPGYDQALTNSVNEAVPEIRSVRKLAKFYEAHNDRLEEARRGMQIDDLIYPQMKLLDMGFWQIGFEKS